jgi:putative transposase
VRGNNRSAIFCADADYLFYLEKLQLACQSHGCQLHAYVLICALMMHIQIFIRCLIN